MTLRIVRQPYVDPLLSADDVLWRYLDPAKLLSFLDSPAIFLSRGDQFADKYEGAFTKSLRNAIEKSYSDNGIQFTFDEFKQRLRERVFVSCWRLGKDDSMAMWSLYGGTPCSVALTTTVGQMRDALQQAKLAHENSIVKVKYVKHWRDPQLNIKPYSNVFAYKVTAYDYENEVRVILDRFHDKFSDEATDTAASVTVTPNSFLRSIVVAPEAPVWFIDLVDRTCRRYGLSVPVRRSKLAFDPDRDA